MKKIIMLFLVFLAAFQLFAADKEEFPLPAKGSFGIVFNFSNIPIIVGPYNDGVMAGAGVKYLFTDKLRLRGLAWMAVDPQGDNPATTELGLSALCEYHFKPGVVSPYVGGMFGVQFDIQEEETAYEIHFGAVGGMEIRIYKNFSVYAEYGAIFNLDEDGLWFNLGDMAMLGVIIYLN